MSEDLILELCRIARQADAVVTARVAATCRGEDVPVVEQPPEEPED